MINYQIIETNNKFNCDEIATFYRSRGNVAVKWEKVMQQKCVTLKIWAKLRVVY